jgi:hypothetical protein
MRRGRALKDRRNGAGEPAILQRRKKRRVDTVVNEVLAQQQDEALLHESLGQARVPMPGFANSATMRWKAYRSGSTVSALSAIGPFRCSNRPTVPHW